MGSTDAENLFKKLEDASVYPQCLTSIVLVSSNSKLIHSTIFILDSKMKAEEDIPWIFDCSRLRRKKNSSEI